MSLTVDYLQSKAYAEATTRARNRAVLAFARFCLVAQLDFFPASDDTLCKYVAYLATHGLKASSIRAYLAHIGTFHKLKGVNDPTQSFALSTTVKGVARIRDSRPESKAPLTPVELVKIRGVLDWTSSLHRTFWACLVIGFWSYLRGSNLVQKTKRDFDNLRHVSPDNVTASRDGVTIALQRTKTIQFNERELRIPLLHMPGNPLCPIKALRDMWELCPAQSGTSLFLFRAPSGRTTPLVHSLLNKREQPNPRPLGPRLTNYLVVIKLQCSLAGLNAELYSGHSLRKGGATCALIAGVSETMVKLQGDWVSDAYRRYISFSLQQKAEVPRQVEQAMLDDSFWARCESLASATSAALYK
jgi:hypothetical protein